MMLIYSKSLRTEPSKGTSPLQSKLGGMAIIPPHINLNTADLAHNVPGIPPVALISDSMAFSFEHYQIDKSSCFQGEFDI